MAPNLYSPDSSAIKSPPGRAAVTNFSIQYGLGYLRSRLDILNLNFHCGAKIRASYGRGDVMFKVMRLNRHMAELSIAEEVLGKLRPSEWRPRLRFATD